MAKLTLDDVGNFNSTGLTTINENSSRIESALENTLSRDGTSPNQMEADLDMNHNDIINVDNIDVDAVQVETLYIDGSLVTPDELIVANAELLDGMDSTEFLWAENNLSDVGDKDQARENLSLLSYEEQSLADTEILQTQDNIGLIRFDTVSDLLADTILANAAAAGKVAVAEGDIVEAQGFRYEVAANGVTDQHLETAGGVKLYARPTQRGEISISELGAVPGTGADVSTIIQTLLPLGPVIVPAGTWRCDTMISIGLSQSLTLAPGARLQRYGAYSASTDPVVWLKESNASLRGAGKRYSSIVTENRAPKGIVRVGHPDMSSSPNVVTFTTLRGMEITGAVAYGQTTGDPDICVFMPNAQIGGSNANYFHTLDDLLLTQANFGLNLRGWANGNHISNINGRLLGNSTWGDGGLIWLQGAVDNSFSNIQFHSSPNQIGIILDDYDNTAVSGGVLHKNMYNNFTGIVCEQGGTTSKGVKSIVSRTTFIGIQDNVAGGNILHSTWNAQGNVLSNAGRSVGVKTGSGFTRTYQAEGTFTVRVGMGAVLTGAVYRQGLVVVRFHGADNGGTNARSSEYRIPIGGTSAYVIGTPVKNWGDDLTITQTESAADHVTFTVAGAATSNRSSLHVEAQAYSGVALD